MKTSQKLHGIDRKLIKVCKKQKSQNLQVSHVSPLCHFDCPYLKIGLCNLFHVLLGCITYSSEKDCFHFLFFVFPLLLPGKTPPHRGGLKGKTLMGSRGPPLPGAKKVGVSFENPEEERYSQLHSMYHQSSSFQTSIMYVY